MNNNYPTVATIIGCPEELKSADGLVATPLVLEEDITMSEPTVQQLLPGDTTTIKDPVQKAIVDNILGKVPTKATMEKLRCDVCNIEVNGKAALLTHFSGSRHAKRLKEEELDKESVNPHIEYVESSKMYHCKLCNTNLNARVQIIAHLQGSRHRTKLDGKSELVPSNISGPNTALVKKKDPTKSGNDPQPYCHTCKLFANSEVQLQQHMASKKHLDKQNRASNPSVKPRPVPYPTKSPKTHYGNRSASGNSYSSQSYNVTFSRNTGESVEEYNGYGFTSGEPGPYQRRSVSYSAPSSYLNLSSNFVSRGIYGAGNNHQPYNNGSYSRNSYTHTYG